MSHSQSVSHPQVPFDISDSTGGAGLPAFGCSGSVLQSLQFMKPTQSVAEVQHLCYLLLKTKRTKQQLWHNHQQQVHGKQCGALSPSHREKLEHLHILFHEDRDTWLCVPQHLVDRGSFNTSFTPFLTPFKEKKNILLTLFHLVKAKKNMARSEEVEVSQITHLASGTTRKISSEHCSEEFPGSRICYKRLSVTKIVASWKQSSHFQVYLPIALKAGLSIPPKRVLNAAVLPNKSASVGPDSFLL